MMSLRRIVCSNLMVSARTPVSKVAIRSFVSQVPLRKDIIQDLYLNSIRGYTAPKLDEKVDLIDKFVLPTAPAAPSVEAAAELAFDEATMEEAEWPALVNPIDDPHNFDPMWEIRTNVDDGNLLPKKLREFDYHAHH